MPQHQQSSLLAAEGQDETPALSSGPAALSSDHEESALSRLIAESTPASVLNPFAAGTMDETTEVTPATPYRRASGTTILAGTLVCLQWGFIWGAYFSNSWMDSHLQVNIDWQQKYLPIFNGHTDFVIQQTSVFTLSDNLKNDENYPSLCGLWFCSIVVPCVFMIVCPIWILNDHTLPPARRHGGQYVTNPSGERPNRAWLELTIRLGWLVVFILLTLNVAIGGIELDWNDTNIQVHNQLKGPYISYLLGCTCALLSVVVLRMPYLENIQLFRYGSTRKPSRNNNSTVVASSEVEPPPPQAVRAPPANAFHLPWLSSSSDSGGSETERLLVNGATSGTNALSDIPPLRSPLKRWQTVVAFQLGLLALLLWIPALALAQFRVLYAGMIADFIKTKAFSIYVWQLPVFVWRTGVQAATPLWVLILVFSIIFTVVVVVPLTAHAVAVMTWISKNQQTRGKLRDVLKLLQPTMCGIPFAMGCFVTVGAFIDIGENIDQSICVKLESIVQNQCLQSGGKILSGCYFLVAQAVALEAFVFFTLQWTAPYRDHFTV